MIKSKTFDSVTSKIAIVEQIKSIDKEIGELTKIAEHALENEIVYSINIYHDQKKENSSSDSLSSMVQMVFGGINEPTIPKAHKKKQIPSINKLKLEQSELVSIIGVLINLKKEQLKTLIKSLE